MLKWNDRPTLIENWDEEIDCVMSIDENGTTDLNGIRKNIEAYINRTPGFEDRWFTITGAIMSRDNFGIFKDTMITLKEKYWFEGKFNYKGKNKRVVFHSREIRKREGAFNPNLINYPKFMTDLTNLIDDTPFHILSASIDKVRHLLQYSSPYHVYTLCLEFIIERFARILRAEGKNGVLLLESRGKNEDRFLLDFIIRFLKHGNRYSSADQLSCIKGVYFNPKWSKNLGNQASYISLELADLVSYPIHKFVKTENKDRAYDVIESKMHNYPFVNGYGLKIFP